MIEDDKSEFCFRPVKTDMQWQSVFILEHLLGWLMPSTSVPILANIRQGL